MPVVNIYSNPIQQSINASAINVGIPRARTINVFKGLGESIQECHQLVAINYGMLSTPPNFGQGPQGAGSSMSGGFLPTSDVIPTQTYSQAGYPTTPYPGLNPTATSVTYPNPTLTGTVASSSSSTAVTGTGTAFTTQVLTGDVLYDITNSVVIGTVATINSDTSITLAANASETASGISVRTGDSIGSIYRLFDCVPANYYLDEIEIYNAAITGGTGYQLGTYGASPVYTTNSASPNSIGTALDLSTAHNYPTPLHGLNNLSLTQMAMYPLWQIDGRSFDREPQALDLCLTSTVAPTAAGLIYVKARFVAPVR